MKFIKKNRLKTAASIAVAFVLCFGATITGAYAAVPLSSSNVDNKEQNILEQNGISKKAKTLTSLTKVEKEYTLSELKALNISGIVVEALSENILITRGGNTLKFQYYTRNKKDYTLQKEDDGGKTRWNLCLKRITSDTKKDIRRITITIPTALSVKVINATTSSGNIKIKNCTSSIGMAAETKTGNITISGGAPSGNLMVKTESGNALISKVALPKNENGVILDTKSGTFSLQPKDSIKNYHFIIDTGTSAQVTINGKKYHGGDYEINSSAKKKIYFDSTKGTLIAQDLSRGKLSATGTKAQSEFSHMLASKNKNAALVRKVYTAGDLKKLGIEGIRVKTQADHIVVKQGKDELVLEYYQTAEAKYTLKTRKYELYNEEYLTPEELASKNGKSGMIKELELQCPEKSTNIVNTISITLPAGTKYSRVVQLISNKGNIQMKNCKSTDMLTAETKKGNIFVEACSSPYLGVETESGQIKASKCKTKELNAKTTSGTFTLQLPDHAADYKMIIDTGKKSHISINGKSYPGGELVLNKKASKQIFFDSKNGSLILTEA